MMTRRQKQTMVVGIAALVFYLTSYAHARMTHRIVHLENRAGGRHQVLARADEWDDLFTDMSEGRPVAEAYARAHQAAPSALNAVFWPLRMIEVTYWNWKGYCRYRSRL